MFIHYFYYADMKTLVFMLFFPLLLFSQSAFVDSISIVQDKRIAHSDLLLSCLTSDNADTRYRALVALGNIQDTTVMKDVLPLLSDPSAAVRRGASFYFGMVGKQDVIPFLMKQYVNEHDSAVVAELAFSIGQCGTLDDLDQLIQIRESLPELQYNAIPQACARFSNRQIRDASEYYFLVSMIQQHRSVYWSTYALMRANDSSIARTYKEVLLQNLKSASVPVVMWTVSILGTSTDARVKKEILSFTGSEYDWKIRVNAIQALRRSPIPEIKDRVRSLISDTNEHISLTAMTAYNGLLTADNFKTDGEIFKEILSDSVRYSYRQRGQAALILGNRMGPAGLDLLQPYLGSQSFLTQYVLRAIGTIQPPLPKAVPIVAQYLDDQDSRNSIAALEAYQHIVRGEDDDIKDEYLSSIIPLFSRRDPGISFTIAVVFEDTAFSIRERKKYLPQLCSAIDSMKTENDIEAMVEILNVFTNLKDSASLPSVTPLLSVGEQTVRHAAEQAYNAITGRPSPIRFVATPDGYTPFYQQRDLHLLDTYSGAVLMTSRGAIHITFRRTAAPFTTLSFIKLAQKNFYTGLIFHRVVSNFVIQGGDPLGNGSGGPGYTLRTEVSPDARYSSGAVGMASAGKDTEGSQFFVTHCPTPHLDGRYTIFGYTKDQNVVDKIMVGDTIQAVTLVQ